MALTLEELEHIIVTYNDYLQRVTEVIRHICDDIRETEYAAVQRILPGLVDGIAWIFDAEEGLNGMGLIEEAKLIEFQNVIGDLQVIMERRDWLSMYLLLSHRLFPILMDLRVASLSQKANT